MAGRCYWPGEDEIGVSKINLECVLCITKKNGGGMWWGVGLEGEYFRV